MERQFDIVVIGTGAGGSSVAHKCRKEGWEVAIIDSLPFGGTCALRGCDPKKVLVGAAELIDWNRRMRGNGIVGNAAEIDWQELMRFKRTFTEPVPANRERAFAKAGISSFHGRAKFLDSTTVQVGDDILTGKFVHIAAGAKPANLGIRGEEHLTTSTDFLELHELPAEITFVGGGYIAFEFAHIAARAGSSVKIIHRGERPLEGFDADLVQTLIEATNDAGIEIILGSSVATVETEGEKFIVRTSNKFSHISFKADIVVHSAGRTPDIDDMNLEKAGIEYGERGIRVNEYLQSVSNPRVYAAGDAADSGGFPLTPVAALEGLIAASNILKGNHIQPDYTGVPTVVFTIPPLSAVGLTEKEAADQGLKFTVKYEDTSGWYSSRRVGLNYSAYKTLVEEDTGRILGAHLLGVHAEEVINIFALAIRSGLTARDLKRMIYAYPTSDSDISYML